MPFSVFFAAVNFRKQRFGLRICFKGSVALAVSKREGTNVEQGNSHATSRSVQTTSFPERRDLVGGPLVLSLDTLMPPLSAKPRLCKSSGLPAPKGKKSESGQEKPRGGR